MDKSMDIKLINQTQKNTCLHCVLAMIIGETEQYVVDWFGEKTSGLYDEDAYIFLAHHGCYLVSFADLKQLNKNGIKVEKDESYQISFNMKTHKAYMVVSSPTIKGVDHAVFWDGEKVLDPLKKEPQEINNYLVKVIYPFIMTEEREKRSNVKRAERSRYHL